MGLYVPQGENIDYLFVFMCFLKFNKYHGQYRCLFGKTNPEDLNLMALQCELHYRIRFKVKNWEMYFMFENKNLNNGNMFTKFTSHFQTNCMSDWLSMRPKPEQLNTPSCDSLPYHWVMLCSFRSTQKASR
jgi:hypothetical protein